MHELMTDPPLFPNSVNIVIYIDREEYILSYKHALIYPEDENLGKFYLSKKTKDKDGNFIQYSSEEKIMAKESLNANVLNNDRQLLHKVVHILEGRASHNESFKLEEDKLLKIVLQMKTGINLVIFTCKITKKVLTDYTQILMTVIRYYKNKEKLTDLVEADFEEKNKKSEVISKNYSNLSRDIENEEKEFLSSLCNLLNSKKQKIRSLQKEIDGEPDSIELSKQESKRESSKKEDDLNQSQTYSLSDLI